MKKQMIALVALAGFAMGASLAYGAAGSAGGGIVGSKHDMNVFIATYGGTADQEGRVCAFCHTPHHAQGIDSTGAYQTSIIVNNSTIKDGSNNTINTLTYNVYSPLWSRQGLSLAQTYDKYVSATFNPDFQGKPYDNLIGPSRLCMTCHDGQIAVDSYYGQTGTASSLGTDNINMFGQGNFAVGLGNGLSNDHPIGMRYSDYNVSPFELNADTTVFNSPASKQIKDVLFVDTTSPDANVSAGAGFVTCASCHDVHNGPEVGNRTPNVAGRGYFLRDTQAGSAFCLVCHNKNS